MIFVFDLEGPLSPMDHAAEAMRVIGKKLKRPDFFDLFQMLSLYDDELTLEGFPGYNPGDTLRLIAPIVSSNLSDKELKKISEKATLTPGAKDLMATLDMKDVYVASTSYSQHAQAVAKKLGIPKSHVNCTKLPRFKEFPLFDELVGIFERYKKSDIKAVKKDLDILFWKKLPKSYMSTVVCGGQRKMDVARRISRERRVPLSKFIVVGDSITDINMLSGVNLASGLAVSFNGNRYSAPKANLCVSSLSLMALRPLADEFPKWKAFVRKWNIVNYPLSLLSKKTLAYFENKKLVPYYDKVSKAKLGEIVLRQKEMRSAIRKQYASLT